MHTDAAAMLDDAGCTDFIEELIDRHVPFTTPLRYLCILSLTRNGLKQKTLDFLMREFIQVYLL